MPINRPNSNVLELIKTGHSRGLDSIAGSLVFIDVSTMAEQGIRPPMRLVLLFFYVHNALRVLLRDTGKAALKPAKMTLSVTWVMESVNDIFCCNPGQLAPGEMR